MAAPRPDRWLPDPDVRTHDRRIASGDADALWRAAVEVRLSDTRALGRLVRWRLPGTPPDQRFSDMFRRYPFTVLEEDDRTQIAGLCGRIWTVARDYPALEGPAAFREWREPGTVRVVFAHWAEPLDAHRAQLVSEARVAAVGRTAALRLRALWAAVGPFERLVGAEALSAAVRRVESGRPHRSPDRPAASTRR